MAKIGDFAIAKFDNDPIDADYDGVPCLITGRAAHNPNDQTFVYWRRNKSGKLIVRTSSLPKNRLKSVKVTLDDVDGLFDEAAHYEVTELLKSC